MSIPTIDLGTVPQPPPIPVIDVREDEEWSAGHIEGALHIPLQQLPARLGEVPAEQTLVVCKAGGRSAQAVLYLAQQGYDVINLAGGMLDWAADGRPMVSETGEPAYVL
ncbi:MAG: rhodanese-like domain-containing protein [Nocardioides sp.]|uniref:rhodanese-like domain-containing protein n=1 Tax=Nocardioides sp. TaxID=35761 RepID=UPI0039E2B273